MKILLCTDGSDFSKVAIDFCRNIIAAPQNTSLKLIVAVERPAPMSGEPFAVSAEYYNGIEQSLREQGNKFVEQAKAQVHSLFPGGLQDLLAEVVTGSPERVIVETAREWAADLIVVGSHGYGFWSRALLGSISNAIVQYLPFSVLVVKTNKEEKKQ